MRKTKYFKVWTIATILEFEDCTDEEIQIGLRKALEEHGNKEDDSFSGCQIFEVTKEGLTEDTRLIIEL